MLCQWIVKYKQMGLNPRVIGFAGFLLSAPASGSSPPEGNFVIWDCHNCALELNPVFVQGEELCIQQTPHCTTLQQEDPGRWLFQLRFQHEDGMEHQSFPVILQGQLSEDGTLSATLVHEETIPETPRKRWRHGLALFKRVME